MQSTDPTPETPETTLVAAAASAAPVPETPATTVTDRREAVAIAARWLAARGIASRPGRTPTGDLADPSLRQSAYEEGRPSAEEACRIGDARFLPGA